MDEELTPILQPLDCAVRLGWVLELAKRHSEDVTWRSLETRGWG